MKQIKLPSPQNGFLIFLLALALLVLLLIPFNLSRGNTQREEQVKSLSTSTLTMERQLDAALVRISGYKKINTLLEDADTYLKPFRDPVDFFVRIDKLCRENSLVRGNVIPIKPLQDGNFAATVTLTGNYYWALEFLAAIKQDAHVMVIRQISIKATSNKDMQYVEGNNVILTMSVETFISKDAPAEPTAPESGDARVVTKIW